ncbi:MAG: hypothetical protein L0Z50_17805, partial [Verrucomicrobiales bacterium]|nr:hypothetical protein [Verrucomicrobiales bacterium]
MNPKFTSWNTQGHLNSLLWSVVALAMSLTWAAAQDKFIAYAVPADTAGNQAFGGTLGMDFDVANAIIVTQLGVFDDNADGLNLPITARLFDRSTDPPTELVSLEFSPDAPGTLVGGSRFKPLTTPLRLATGFEGTIVAEGYGAEERLRNTGIGGGVIWTLNDGKGSIQFVGNSRYGTVAGEYPGTVDGGPAARYAAGTFEFETTPPELPGKPLISLKPADKQITISWPAVTQPAPAAKYRVLRGSSSTGPLSQIAEISETTYVDAALANGTLYCYAVAGVTAEGKAGPDSETKCATPYAALPANQHIAYFVPAGLAGNQDFGGSLGLDFDVQNPIIIQQLGVFDDTSDGLKLPLTARIFNRDDETILAEVAFTPEEPGLAVEGMRFKPLAQPLRLETGFRGTMQADGYGNEEKLHNTFGDTDTPWTLDDGNGSIQFVGGSRYGTTPGEYPATPDTGPPARYAAGSFQFETTAPQKPGAPQLSVLLPPEDASATLEWNAVLNPLPASKYQVFRATSADGPFTQIAEVTAATYHDMGLANGTTVFYKVRGVGAGGENGLDSNVVNVTPNPRRAGVAYLNPAGIDGNQNFGGSLGLDFEVVRPIRITRLGVFDELSDGLNL